jgi:glucose-6-phosphate 1-dehydrogenase
MNLAPAPPQTIVIFGASGDLTRRKLLPALYQLSRQGLLPERYGIVGYARTDWDDDSFRDHARAAVEEFSRTPVEDKQWKTFADSLSYVAGAFDGPACFGPLADHLARLDDEWGAEGRRLYYCATPPSAYPHIARRLGECGVEPGHRIVVEKPFGRDVGSARDLNRILHGAFDESQVFRIDHYLGKETVQNLLVLRFANSMFERVWNRDAIDHVQITVAESVGLEGRGSYYEEAGAVRDMLQNHLLQVLAILAMEPPRALEAEAIRDEKVKLLRALRPLDPTEVVRGQYTAGTLDGRPVPGYRDEPDVAPASTTPTYVAVRAHIENWRWAGVPFYLRTGKRLPRRTTEVMIGFRQAPAHIFETAGVAAPDADHLVIRIQPEEGTSFAFQAKQPGPGFTPTTVRMDFSYGASFAGAPAEAYERLLYDALVGDRTLFIREDGIERSWEVVAPALEQRGPIHLYPAGSWGPSAADELLAPRRWHLR